MEYTSSLKLKKPGYLDPVDIKDLNDNFDTLDTLNARVENLITELQEDPDYAPTAEVVDIRTGYDGSVYSLAGDAVRAIGNELLTIKEDVEQMIAEKAVDGLYYEDSKLYLTANGEIVSDPVEIVSGGGGGTGGSTYEVSLKNSIEGGSRNVTVAYGDECILSFTYTSVDTESYGDGNGSGSLIIDNVKMATFSVPQGEVYDLDIAQYLTAGEHTVKIRVENSEGSSRTIIYTVTLVALSMSTTMDAMGRYSGNTTFYYTPVGAGDKTIHFIMDGNPIGTAIVSASGRSQSYTIPAQTHGAHVFEAYASIAFGTETVVSNTIRLGMIWVDEASTTAVVMSTFDKTTSTAGTSLTIPYMVYVPSSESAAVTLSIINTDNSVYSSQTLTVGRDTQTWVTANYPVGAIKFRIAVGDKFIDLPVNVSESTVQINPVTDGLTFDFNPNGRNNMEDNPAQWTNGSVSATFDGVGFSSADGWMTDADGAYMLRLLPGSEMTIPFRMFENDARAAGMTVEVEMSTHNVRDYDTVVMSSFSGGRGLKIASQYAQLVSEQSELSMQFKEDDKVRVSFVIEPQNLHRLLYIYVDGIMCGVAQYPNDDNFAQTSPVGLTIGAETSGIDIYRIRVYNKGLSRYEVLDNYIADRATLAERINLVERNDIFDVSDNIVINKLPPTLPYMIIKCPELPQTKGDKKNCEIEYVNVADSARSFTASGVQIDVQGTSSAGYKKKNWKIKLKNGITYTSSKTESEDYKLRENSIPSAVFCMKADVASSEGANNVELVKLYNDTVPHKTPAQLLDERVRVGIDGLPCVIFWQNTDTNETHFWGKYNFNYDKSSEEAYGLTDGCESWEICNNTSNRVLFKTSDFNSVDSDGNPAWLNDFEGRYPDGSTMYTNLKVLCDWLVSTDRDAVSTAEEKAARLEKFKNEFEDHFIKEPTLFYYVFTEVFLMVDNRAKNFFPTTFDGVHWFPFPYDMDTALGINNEGELVFDYDLEDTDKLGNADVFNGQSSTLWCNVRDAFYDDIKDIYTTLRSGTVFNYDTIIKRFADHQAVWPEAVWNEDAWNKYLEPMENDNDPSYLEMLQGNKASQREWWLYNGIRYRDSKYQCGEAKSKFITLRCYEVGDITLTPYSHIWPWIKYGSYTVHERGKRNVPVTLECPLDTMNDTEVYIYSADRLAAIGDLSPMQVGYADFTDAVKLQSLKLGDGASDYTNTRLTALSVGNNELLTSLDVQNCVNLAQSVDLSGCVSLEEVKAKGTITTGFSLPVGGKLKTLELPATVTNLTIRDQAQFETLDMAGYGSIETLRIESTPNVPIEAIVAGATNLNRVRLINVEWNAASEATLQSTITKLKTCIGQDAAGANTSAAVVTGRVYVPSVSAALLEEINNAFPELIVVANGVPQYIVRYLDWNNTVLYRAVVAEGANAVDAVVAGYISAPTRAGTETTGYAFKDFGTLPTNIRSNVTVIAQYENTYRVRFMNETVAFETQWVVEGDDATIPSGTPTKADETEYKYTFKEWSGVLTNITAPVDITAVYTTIYRVRFMNEGSVYDTQWITHGGNATAPSGTPTKASTAQFDFSFASWDGSLTNVTEPRTITAVYSSITRKYTVTFYNESTKLLEVPNVSYGGSATYTGATPVKTGVDDPENWEFTGWDPSGKNITGATSCYAQFKFIGAINQTWAEISEISAAGTGENYFAVGDCKEIALNGTMGIQAIDTSLYVYILGFNHNSAVEGTGITFGGFKTSAGSGGKDVCLIETTNYNSYLTDGTKTFNQNHWGNSNYGGWKGCDLRYDILGSTDVAPSGYGSGKSSSTVGYDATATCATNPVANTLMSCLPADLRAVMKPMTKWTNNSGGSGDTEAKVTTSIDYLPLLAEFEIFGARTYANSFEQNHQQQYAYYAAGNSKVKYRHSSTGSTAPWWERSPYYNISSGFCCVSTGGGASNDGARRSYGVAPAFLI